MTVPTPPIPDSVRQDLQRLGVALPEEHLHGLSRYLDLLLEANQQFNLTAVRDRDQAWRRHIIDSLTLLPLLAALPAGARVIDVGSGGGLPGLPLAIALPQFRVLLLEATGKKAAFLERCAAQLGIANARVLKARAETIGHNPAHRQGYDVGVCRAIGPMTELLEYLLPLIKVGGRVLAMKGPKVETELDQAGDALALLGGGELEIISAYPDAFNMEAVIVCVTKDRPTPKQFPRPPGTPRHEPL